VKCPWCPLEAAVRPLHAHLTQDHGDHIRVFAREDRQFYQVVCPYCDQPYEHRIKKAGLDDAFLTEFEQQIRMVAFDMLINHVIIEHEPQPAGG
jgi:uncharacterized Zn-finger protein